MLQKAVIFEIGTPSRKVEFQFNPETIRVSKSASWIENRTQSSQNGPVRQFEGARPIDLTLSMTLDDTDAGGSSVANRVNLLVAWTNPDQRGSSRQPEPPELGFEWGEFRLGDSGRFVCHLESVDVEFTLFSSSGVPLRATATTRLVGTRSVKRGQNPTSGGLQPLRSTVLIRGDDLAVIAHREYGSTRYWRAIADRNGIDNPFRLPSGREVVLPEPAESGI